VGSTGTYEICEADRLRDIVYFSTFLRMFLKIIAVLFYIWCF